MEFKGILEPMEIYSFIPGASREYQDMIKRIIEKNSDKTVEEVAELLEKIETKVAHGKSEYAKILGRNE